MIYAATGYRLQHRELYCNTLCTCFIQEGELKVRDVSERKIPKDQLYPMRDQKSIVELRAVSDYIEYTPFVIKLLRMLTE